MSFDDETAEAAQDPTAAARAAIFAALDGSTIAEAEAGEAAESEDDAA
ncbi:MAG: hypothetical protein QOI48_1373 [Solirubrobacteraceae bacterium]|jgi:hypothetical protein|nr:hypothetical protein [Solirubrobacteraceae bacterium]